MKKTRADIKTLHSKTTAFLKFADRKKSLYKKIQRIKVNIVYNKKFLKLNKTLTSTPKAQTSSKAKSDLKKHTAALTGLIATYKKYTKSSEGVKKERESLLAKIKGYETPFKLTHKKYLARQESKLAKRLGKKMLACEALEAKWKTEIAKAKTWRAKLEHMYANIKKNQKTGDSKKREWQLEENYKIFFKSKISLIAKYETQAQSIKKCGKQVKNLKFLLMKIRYRSVDHIAGKWAAKKIESLSSKTTWRLNNSIRYILTKNEFEKIDLDEKMAKILKIKNNTSCLKGVLLWEEVGREVTKEREHDWLSYFTPDVKNGLFATFKGLEAIYAALKTQEALRANAYVRLSKIHVKIRAGSQNPNIKDELDQESRKIKMNYFKSDLLYERFSKAIKKAKKSIQKTQARIVKKIMRDGVARRVWLMKKVRKTMTKKIRKLKKRFFTVQKKLVYLRKVYHEKIDSCLMKSGQNCDKSDLRKRLRTLANRIEPLVEKRQKINEQVFRMNKEKVRYSKEIRSVKKEALEKDAVALFLERLTENYIG